MFSPRLTDAGMRGSSYWYSGNPFYQSGYGLPNCTCYAYGRFWEINGQKPTGLSLGNAGTWFGRTTGFQKGQTPKLGAIICYGYNDGGAGHVAVVEKISGNSIITSNSGWGSSYFWTEEVYKSNNYVPSWCDGYTQGFIYATADTGTVTEPTEYKFQSITGYGQEYLNEKSINNAYCVANYLTSKGWSLNAISGILGNMLIESFISPNLREIGVPDSENGYGLVQWTPAVDTIIPYMNSKGVGIDSDVSLQGYTQLERLVDESEGNPNEWILRGFDPPEFKKYATFKDFTVGTDTPEIMAGTFVCCYERPSQSALEQTLPKRQEFARWFFENLKDLTGYIPNQPTSRVAKKRMPLYLYPFFMRRFL